MSLSQKFKTEINEDDLDGDTVDRTHTLSIGNLENTSELKIFDQKPNEKKYFITICQDTNSHSLTLPIETTGRLLSEDMVHDDFRNSFHLLSVNSSILSEDLIIDEDIEYLYSDKSPISSNPSKSPSMLYTITDENYATSSVFQSFNWENCLMKSLPQSVNSSCVILFRSFETQDPCKNLERNDIKSIEFIGESGCEKTPNNDVQDDFKFEIEGRATGLQTGTIVIENDRTSSCCNCSCWVF